MINWNKTSQTYPDDNRLVLVSDGKTVSVSCYCISSGQWQGTCPFIDDEFISLWAQMVQAPIQWFKIDEKFPEYGDHILAECRSCERTYFQHRYINKKVDYEDIHLWTYWRDDFEKYYGT